MPHINKISARIFFTHFVKRNKAFASLRTVNKEELIYRKHINYDITMQ